MPRSTLGQLISFATEQDADRRTPQYVWVRTIVGDTVKKIAARRGHPEDARFIAKLNKIRSVNQILLHEKKRKTDRTRIRVPGNLRRAEGFHVLAGDRPPRIVAGYQKLEILDRPGRTGLTHFTGYDPLTMEVPIQFEQVLGDDGEGVEERIALLERMAGRGNFKGASAGAAAIIRLSTTRNNGDIVPLLPPNYQWSPQNPAAPQWRIANIDWDDSVPDGVLRDDDGNRVRQKAVVTVMQHTRLSLEERSVTKRHQDKKNN